MKYNSELPLELLNDFNIENNDFDFVLFHLYEQCAEYRDYYKNLKKTHPERLIILDNSAYEYYVKGQELDDYKFLQAILDLNPDYYLLPDKLMDKDATINGVVEFITKYQEQLAYGCTANPLVVIQGNTENEMIECLEAFQSMGLYDIAVPFHNSFFKTMPEINYFIKRQFADAYNTDIDKLREDHYYAMGRVKFMQKWVNWIRRGEFKDAYIHMLGSHCPHESAFYEDLNINSMDTGYPVKCSMRGLTLYREPFKPNILIDNFFDDVIGEYDKKLIRENLKRMKQHHY